MKKYIAVTIIGLMTIMTTTVSAESPTAVKKKCNLGKAFVEDVDLTADQKDLMKELRDIKKENRGQMKKNPGEKIDMMISFVEGDLSRRDMHRKITADHNNKVEHMSEIQEALFDLLDSYSDEQKDQVEANLEEKLECIDELKSRHGKKTKEDHKKYFWKRLFKNLDLTEEQQEMLADLDQGKKKFYKNHKGGHREMLADILAEELNSDDARELFLKKSADQHELAHNQADVMMDFLETLSEEQKEQFIENAEQIQEKMKEKMKEKMEKHEKNRDFEKKGFEDKE